MGVLLDGQNDVVEGFFDFLELGGLTDESGADFPKGENGFEVEILLLDLDKDFEDFINVEHQLFPEDGLVFHESDMRVLPYGLCFVNVVVEDLLHVVDTAALQNVEALVLAQPPQLVLPPLLHALQHQL